ncbi:g1798 [Coccomyxa viridis]|uniref:G1798 protein n=1 Tax=Coccomyxa viridis TaxID=1274662 RepID=A0ABP1FLT2_9CHLO
MGADLRSLRDVRGHAGAAIVHKQAAASAQQDDRGHMSVALQQELANRLMKMDETKMKSVLEVIVDCQNTEMIDENGEVVVDFELLTPFTLWKLYDFAQQSAQTANVVALDSTSPTMNSSHRHFTEGVAVHSYEPASLEADSKASLPQPTSSGGCSSQRKLSQPASNKQQQQQQEDDRGEMPMALMQEMANSLGQMDETGMNDVLQIVRDCQDVDLTNADGEVELDFDLLKPVTLWKLYDFTKRTAQTANGVVDESNTSEAESDDWVLVALQPATV